MSILVLLGMLVAVAADAPFKGAPATLALCDTSINGQGWDLRVPGGWNQVRLPLGCSGFDRLCT